jgi:hypothetical protein
MTEYINHTEERLLNIITELQLELETCQDPEMRKELQDRIDENFITLGIFYKTYLYGKE